MATLDELKITITADSAQLERALKNAQQQTQDTGNRMRAVLTDLRGQFAALVPALSVAAVVSFGRQAFAAADHINDLAQRTGFAGSTLSALNTPLKQSGSSLDEFAGAMARLNNALGEAQTGNHETVKSFDQLGLSVTKLLALPQEERFFAVARALSGLKDITQQQAAAQNLMGRGAAVLIPLINELGGNMQKLVDDAKRTGKAISDEDLKRIDEFGDKWTAVVEQLQVSFTAFTPVLDAVVEAFQTLRVLNPVELGSRIGRTIGEEYTGQAGYGRKAKAGGFATEATVVSGYTFDAKGNLVPPGAKANPAAGSNAGLLKGTDKDTEKAVEDYDTLNNEMERYLTNLENERELAGLSGKALEVRKAILEATAIATKDGNLLSEEAVQQITAEVEATYDLQEAQRKLEQQTRDATETQRELTNAFRDGLTEIVLHFDSARDAAKNFFEEIASQIIKRKITGPLAQGIGDALGGDIFGSIGGLLGFADGGRPPVGRASIVGENGPELFVPDSAGTVIPNGAMGGKSVTVTNVFNISTGIQGTVRQELMSMMPAITANTKAAVFGAIERGGSESRMVGKRN
ncbi:hypothetical protein J8F10_24065 [Gemmata sp. G18]|uniref:Bacteriophage tail tape measure C-terminal domain-containing protein n=1 Tax=Gemmata palustris TaxID=2822762 RepID=A0ABS5BX61_9BACT|nr:hypothetical protein [Gemmata palustris]MBP3958336.1 hypothetical protein [Gemmata palustris]